MTAPIARVHGSRPDWGDWRSEERVTSSVFKITPECMPSLGHHHPTRPLGDRQHSSCVKYVVKVNRGRRIVGGKCFSEIKNVQDTKFLSLSPSL